ncbi:BON domain-containing protein [Sphingopyxis sp.]|uniref:BON domain-containing protein n=1 Tax=Sphingopyxis sp. TaxID=1908224 RepID=UPI0039C91F80
MDRYGDRTPLWDYSDNSDPGDGSGSGGWDRGRAEDASRAYTAIEEDSRQREAPRRYREGARRKRWAGSEGERGNYDPRENWRPRERDVRYERAVGEARGAREQGGWWPAELGYPPAGGYSPYGGGRRSYTSRYVRDDEDRGFFDRAGDEVMSWFGDCDARRRREQDHRGRGPKNYARSDERIREDVNDRLTEDVWIDASEIEVAVEAGEVTLSGTVEDRRAKRRAEDCADAVSGVKHVQNNLRYTSGVVSPKLD